MNIEEENEQRLVDISEQMPGAVTTMAPRFAPDGRQVVFTGGFSDAVELFLVDTDNGDLVQISDGGYNQFASFSPDGKQITFTCEGEQAIPMQICVMNVDGTGKTRVTDAKLIYEKPVFTPDGEHILVSAYRGAFLRDMFGQTDPYNIHLVSTDGLELRRIVSDEREFAVAFSADGREIVYHTSDEDTGHTTGIYVMNVDGSNRRRLGDDWWDVARQGGGLSE
jgi:TolB protein